MMSVSPGMAARQAGGYFSREDYYLRGDDLGENSLWLGRGSRELGEEGCPLVFQAVKTFRYSTNKTGHVKLMSRH